MTGFKLIFYKLYIFFLSLWMGAGIYTTLAESQGWYNDPVTYIDHITSYPVPGSVDPWTTLTVCLSIVTILCILLFMSYHGPGRRTALVSFSGTFIILFFTYLYFIPVKDRLFDVSGTFNNQVVSMSRMWIILNYIRFLIVVFIFFTSLVALSKFKSSRY